MKFRGSEYGFQFETKGAKAVQILDKVVCIGPQATTKKMAKDLYGLQAEYCDICKVEVFQSESN